MSKSIAFVFKIYFAMILLSLPLVAQEHKEMVQDVKVLVDKPLNFVEKVKENYLILKTLKNDSQNCVDYILDRIKKIDNLTSNSFFPRTDNDKQILKEKGVETLDRLFQIRNLIRAKQKELTVNNRLNYQCLQSIKTATRYIRFMEEMLLEWLVDQNVIVPSESGILQGKPPQVMSNFASGTDSSSEVLNSTAQVKERLHSGDILMIRGQSYVSAMIARIGDAEMQFSHLAIVGLDEKNEKVIVEALIPFGSKISNLDDWLTQKDPRVVLLRFEDTEVASKAGREAFNIAKEFIQSNKKNIPYDFNMNAQDQSQMFCAELIENSFLKASDFKIHLPQYKTLATKFKSTPFLKSMGITTDTLFSPGDIEFDSRFQLVADYRFLESSMNRSKTSLLRKVRMQDAIIQSLYNWMIQENYQLQPNLIVDMKTYLAKALRMLGFFQEKFPEHMPMESLNTIMYFEEISKIFEEKLLIYEQDFYQKNGHSLHFQEMLNFLNSVKRSECQDKDSQLNQLFKNRNCLG